MYEVETYSAIGLYEVCAQPVVQKHGITKPPRHEVPPVVGSMHGMRYHMNSHAGNMSYMPSRCNSGSCFTSTRSFRCVVRYLSHTIDNSSRKGFREKDPGYVGIRANKDRWWDLCTESNTSFEVLFHYQRQRESLADMARDASTRNHSLLRLCPVSYLRFFENAWSPPKR